MSCGYDDSNEMNCPMSSTALTKSPSDVISLFSKYIPPRKQSLIRSKPALFVHPVTTSIHHVNTSLLVM